MERWLNKVSSSLHPVISLRNVDHGNTRKIKIRARNVKNHRKDTRAKVDKHPLISYI
jgi:hypothetical protein